VPAQPPIIINNNGGSGLGHVVAGAIIARSAANAHANNNNGNGGGYYPAPSGGAGGLANQAGADAVDTAVADATATDTEGVGFIDAVITAFKWLGLLAFVTSIFYATRKRKKRREANKSNYSFERK
jgi:hypothetical protein